MIKGHCCWPVVLCLILDDLQLLFMTSFAIHDIFTTKGLPEIKNKKNSAPYVAMLATLLRLQSGASQSSYIHWHWMIIN